MMKTSPESKTNRHEERSSAIACPPQLLWDYPFARLGWTRDRDLIVARVLAAGSLESIRWLRRRLGDADLRGWIEHREGAGLSPQQLRYWQLILDIPPRVVTRWLRQPGRQLWDKRLRR